VGVVLCSGRDRWQPFNRALSPRLAKGASPRNE
jgi:hypothetical protein